MKIMIYGAGVIGSYLTHVLCAAGNDVTLLARESRQEIMESPAVKASFTGKAKAAFTLAVTAAPKSWMPRFSPPS